MRTVSENIIVAGFGGQGIMMLGKIIAQAGMLSGLQVTWIPKYGAEVRGGTAHCMVKVSSEEIASPLVTEPNLLVVMNKPSILKFERIVKPKGFVVLNASLCDYVVEREDLSVVSIPATQMANDIGDVRGANMVALGALLKLCPFLELSVVVAALKDILPTYRHKYIPLNEKALYEGFNFRN
ncbi:MAG: 2-oxoacid:acceptor oxidoreductase family protein [Candidatus Omnitrophica bacterium]|nr:2-oxoacid:acceptor oxidoreductase family protein [Candidatus Omnitrophota bacterium]